MIHSTFAENFVLIEAPQLPRRRDPSVTASSQQPVNEDSDRIADCSIRSAYSKATFGSNNIFVSASNASPAPILRFKQLHRSASSRHPHDQTAKASEPKFIPATGFVINYTSVSLAAFRRASIGPSTPPSRKTHLRCGSTKRLTIESRPTSINAKFRA